MPSLAPSSGGQPADVIHGVAFGVCRNLLGATPPILRALALASVPADPTFEGDEADLISLNPLPRQLPMNLGIRVVGTPWKLPGPRLWSERSRPHVQRQAGFHAVSHADRPDRRRSRVGHQWGGASAGG